MNYYSSDLSKFSTRPQLSVVAPMYNEEENLSELFTRLTETLNQIGMTYEIICVNDGSRDNTLERVDSDLAPFSLGVA
ncbi:MAG: glycosyltransferase [Cyanobacteria bacterium P01_D01_bin.105]